MSLGMPIRPVYASATVDVISENHFLVEVWGREPHDYVRRYKIFAKDEGKAAFEGIDRFKAEMEELDRKNASL